MAKKSMSEFAKGWKSPDQKREERREAPPPGEKSMKGKMAANRKEEAVAKKEAGAAPKNSTGMKGKNSPDSKGPGAKAWDSKASMKKPKGGGK